MKKIFISIVTLLSACFIQSSAQTVSIALDGAATTVATKTSTNVDFLVDITGAADGITNAVNFEVIPAYFGEIVVSGDPATAVFNAFVTTGAAKLVITLNDDNTVTDTLDVTFTGDDQATFYVATDGAAANWGSTTADAVDDVMLAMKYASPGDKIMFAAGEYLVSEEMPVTADISFEGAGMGQTILKNNADFATAETRYETNMGDPDDGLSDDANGDKGHRFISVGVDADTSLVVSMKDMTFKYWTSYSAGGIVYAKCHLTMENVEVRESFAIKAVALYGEKNGNFVLLNCNFSDNYGLWYGDANGGVQNGGAVLCSGLASLLMDGCVIDNNMSRNDDSNDLKNGVCRNRSNSGAGMNFHFNATAADKSNIVIKNSTFSNNNVQTVAGGSTDGANGNGAGLLVTCNNYGTALTMQSNLLIQNCTFAGNSGVSSGGLAILANSNNDDARVHFNVINNTIAFNTSSNAGGNTAAGGLLLANEEMTVVLENNIIADNTSADVAMDLTATKNFATKDGGAPFTSSNNIVIAYHDQYFTDFATGNTLGVQTGLFHADSLADNGGPVPTIALVLNSAAIDPVTTNLAPMMDARGVDRDATPDIGAYEYNSVPTAVSETSIALGVVMYPNPASDRLSFNVPMKTVQVFNITGQLMMQSVNTKTLDVSSLNGLYLLKGVSVDGDSISQKLMVK